ncbi:MAG: CHAT domain-containing protein [Cyanobacteriota bacterium]|nr:CHAT domain-containing protein [Cyanobacteriota bacterium]
MFQEFQISVTPLERNQYLVRTEKVAPGVPLAEELVVWSVEEWLEEARQLMNDPLLRVFQGAEPLFVPSNSPQEDDVSPVPIALGQKLYNALFQGSLRDSWITAQGIAHYQRSPLRLRLGLKGPVLPRLPWEVLHSGEGESSSACYRPVATGTDIAFSRHQTSVPTPNPTVEFARVKDRPLRILMAIAGPDDRESLDVRQEAEDLQIELAATKRASNPPIELILLSNPGREELVQALEQGQYEVFHYAGHSNLGDSGGDIYLVNRNTGLTETLSGEDLAGLLANNGVQLAVFNSCRGADTALAVGDATEGDRNLAQALVKCGIPAVLAMAERIPDDVAKTLARLFYRNVNQGYPIDLSLSRTRAGLIAAYGSNQLYWALPVLYLHPRFNGMLMDVAEEEALGSELLELSEEDEIPLELLGEEERFDGTGDGGDESEFLVPVEPLDGAKVASSPESETLNEEETFIRDLMSDLAPAQSPPAPQTAPLVPAQASVPETAKSAPSPPPRRFRRWLWVWLLLGAMGLSAIAFLGWWFILGRNSSEPVGNGSREQRERIQSQSTNNSEFSRVSTEDLTARAIEEAIQGNLEESAIAIEELLAPQRNALQYAQAVLNAVPTERQDDPEILFLQGRVAWQSVLQGNTDFSIDDARRYWESAAKKEPNSLLYQNALGFAYYEEGDFTRANLAWSDALELSQEQVTQDEQGLTTYAGLALAMRQMAATQSDRAENIPIDKALKLRQLVITQDPVNFQSEALSNNWLWSEKAIRDWQALGSAIMNNE